MFVYLRHHYEMRRQIHAAFDDSGIIVYQAFPPDTVLEAVRRQAFGKGFGLDRMTWIKPSLGWMLYRSGYASKDRQQRIAQVTITHDGFRTMLADAVPSRYERDLFASSADWSIATNGTPIATSRYGRSIIARSSSASRVI